MPEFAVHTFVHRDGEPVSFGPGDEVPEWASDLVGAHVLAEPKLEADPEPEAQVPATVATDPASEPVDFTGTKPRGTRQRRS